MKYHAAAPAMLLALAMTAQGDQAYRFIGLPDLKTDIGTLVGKKVETTGLLQVVVNLDMVFLRTDEFDMAPVIVDGNKLPRDDRKKLLNGCQMILCKATVSGTVRKPPYQQPIITADAVVWK